jgi:hypothetical protein
LTAFICLPFSSETTLSISINLIMKSNIDTLSSMLVSIIQYQASSIQHTKYAIRYTRCNCFSSLFWLFCTYHSMATRMTVEVTSRNYIIFLTGFTKNSCINPKPSKLLENLRVGIEIKIMLCEVKLYYE